MLGFTPWKRERSSCTITLVMGKSSQLLWDIPAADSLLVLQEIFHCPRIDSAHLAELTDLLELEPLLGKPVRSLAWASG